MWNSRTNGLFKGGCSCWIKKIGGKTNTSASNPNVKEKNNQQQLRHTPVIEKGETNNNELQQFLMSQFKAHSSHLFSNTWQLVLSVSFNAFALTIFVCNFIPVCVCAVCICMVSLCDYIRVHMFTPCVEIAPWSIYS